MGGYIIIGSLEDGFIFLKSKNLLFYHHTFNNLAFNGQKDFFNITKDYLKNNIYGWTKTEPKLKPYTKTM
mgnify:CR=1 FL=1